MQQSHDKTIPVNRDKKEKKVLTDFQRKQTKTRAIIRELKRSYR